MSGELELAAGLAGALAAGCAAAHVAGRHGAGPRLRAGVIGAAPVLAACAWSADPTERAAWGCILGLILLTLAAIDLAAFRLPDVLTLPLAVLGLVQAWVVRAELTDRALGLAAGLLAFGGLAWIYRRVRGRPGLGAGDVKLLAAVGAWVGWEALPVLVLGACALAAVALVLRALKGGLESLERPFPFGAALAAAAFGVWLLQSLEIGLA